MKPATVVLAAGEGRRFGAAKQLAPIDGTPLLRRALEAISGAGEPQVVVLGAAAERVREVVPAGPWKVVVAADWAAGPGASLRAGLAAVPAAPAVLVSLGDLPWLRPEALARLLAAADQDPEAEAVRCFEGSAPGHPVLLRGALLERARSSPDRGMGELLAAAPVLRVECEGLGVARDVDVPADAEGQGAEPTLG
jgi:nicotine blue oxidoreductase